MYVQSPAVVCPGRPWCRLTCSLSHPDDCASGHNGLATPTEEERERGEVGGGEEMVESFNYIHEHVFCP